MTSLLRTYEGSCHCGALGYSFQTSLPVTQWRVRACGCGFCRAHDALTTSDPRGQLTFHLHRGESLQRYRFGLMTADFVVCRSCGVYVGAQIQTAAGAFAIINTRALLPVPEGLPVAAAVDYSAESTSERLARRVKRWTPLVRMV